MGKIAKKILPKIIRESINHYSPNIEKNFRTYFYYNLLKKKNVFGNKMYLKKPSYVSWKLSFAGIHEELETNYIIKSLKKGQVVIDIGANIGYYTLLFAKLVGSEGLVFAFEPEISNFNLLKKNVLTNSYQNVKLEKCALGNKNSFTTLFLSKTNAGQHRIYKAPSENNDSFQKIEIKKLDDYLKFSNFDKKISFIKMDVEGSELEVLKGMEKTLQKNDNLKILAEFTPSALREFGSIPKEFLEFFIFHNFKIHFFDYESKSVKNIRDIDFFLEKYDSDQLIRGSLPMVNLLCEKKNVE